MALYRRPGSRHWWTRIKVRGKTIRRTTGTEDQSEARAKAAEIEAAERKAAGSSRPAPTGGGPLIAELATADIEAAKARGVASATVDTLTIHWRALRWSDAFGGGHGRAGVVTRASLQAYALERRATGTRGQTIRRELRYLRRALVAARERGESVPVIEPWPTVRSDAPHPTRRGREIPPHLVSRFVAELPADGLREVYAFALLTGLRAEEIHRLTLAWVEGAPAGAPLPGVLHVPAHGAKTRRSRVVGLTESALAILQRLGTSDLDAPVFARQDRRVTVRLAAKRAGMAFAPTLRDCRTTHASLAAYTTGDAKAVQAALGHTDLGTTNGYMRSTLLRTLGVAASVEAIVTGGVTVSTRGGGTAVSPAKTEAADFSAASDTSIGARDWTRTSMSYDTNPSRDRERGVSCSCCASRCAVLRHLPASGDGGVSQGVAQRKGAA